MRSHSWLVSLSHLKQLVVDYVGNFLFQYPWIGTIISMQSVQIN